MFQRPQQNRHNAAAAAAETTVWSCWSRLIQGSGFSDSCFRLIFSLLFCLQGPNVPGFQAAAPPASGLDTGPYSGRPGRVHCLGVCKATKHNNTDEDKVTHQLSSFTRRDDKDYRCDEC